MIERMKTSWELFKASWRIAIKNPKLFVFPLLSIPIFLALVIPFILTFVVVMVGHSQGGWMTPMMADVDALMEALSGPEFVWVRFVVWVVGGFVVLVGSYWITLFSQTALMTGVQACFRHEPVSIRRAIQQAWARRWLILQWAVVSAVVQGALHVLRMGLEKMEKIPWLGRLIGSFVVMLMGVAWNLATFLVLPVLVYEWLTPREALKRSVQLVKQRAGETVTGIVGFSVA